MNTQNVCTLETAKRRKELGLSQEDMYYWIERKLLNGVILTMVVPYKEIPDISGEIVGSAPLASETLDRLPNHIKHERKIYYFEMLKGSFMGKNNYHISYNYMGDILRTISSDSLSECACLMEIYLKEKNII
jgi:hypothetical protein